ncbi:hypothetical protein EYC84_006544 [Monilinia fructicola]|uniref:Uncharacterized protein n=1 Tax=Monilinia fructicola TaxID=38448 RepID=A0A5M9K3R6_MONFR|nr:hypothetical protein EYC84_006544 [Monilinia fructicola]
MCVRHHSVPLCSLNICHHQHVAQNIEITIILAVSAPKKFQNHWHLVEFGEGDIELWKMTIGKIHSIAFFVSKTL